MAARQTRNRDYDLSDLRTLMDGGARPARNWDDVLHGLESPVNGKPVTQLYADVRHLRDSGMSFTGDYREIWKELTGENTSHLSAPRQTAAPRQTNAGESRNALTDENDGIHRAASNPSSRVLDVLQRVKSKEYRDMAGLGSSGATAWNRKP
ncbi:MAG TPA: hypothetical protein VF267_10575 [Gammaproteobacteria bacterium]